MDTQPNVIDLIQRQRGFFSGGATLALGFRRDALRRLRASVICNEAKLLDALHRDLRKPCLEAYASEIAIVISEIDYAIKHLKAWAKPRKVPAPRLVWPARARVSPCPYGITLIIGPWNYPVQLLLLPLVGAVAAGNCTIVKPSELAPQTAQVVGSILDEVFPAEHVAAVQGDQRIAGALLNERFDKLFFTGSTAVGRVVAAAAAAHLSPVTLELGGKCPVIVCGDANLRVAARRIIWAKTLNAGQSCVAPDYLLVHQSVRDRLVEEMLSAIAEMFGRDVQKSPDFGRIMNRRHFDRLAGYLSSGSIITGGQLDPADLFVAPTLLDRMPTDAPIMSEEIFGPILPIVSFESLSDAIDIVRSKPSALAVYLFSTDSANQTQIERNIQCGGICVNDLMVHLFGKQLPFGGVGEAGMGAYHGKASFDCFSHYRSILNCSTTIDLPFRYPPPRLSLRRMKQLLPWLLRR
jgi:aldehyde dehydrogenase (NAD+)